MLKLLIIISLTVSIVSCSLNPFSNDDPPQDNAPPRIYDYDHLSAAMACWYFESEFPDDDIAQNIYEHLQIIDSTWNDSVSLWSEWIRSMGSLNPDREVTTLKFIPPYKMSQIDFYIPVSYADSFIQGIHPQFNLILDSLSYDSLVWYEGNYYPSSRKGSLFLTGVQNSFIFAKKFSGIEKIRNIFLDHYFDIGDYSNLLPLIENGKYKYFYIFNWGDCPAGCIATHIFYFEIENGKAQINGIYDNRIYTDYHFPWVDTLRDIYRTKWRYPWSDEL